MIKEKYTKTEVLSETLKYFNGDELATDVWMKKYCLKDDVNYYEKTPDDMHRRIAKELARVELKYPNPLNEEEIYETLKNFKRIIPQGSPMSGIGNDFQVVSLSNCFVVGNDGNSDSYGGIMKIDQEIVQLEKRRGGVGTDLSFIRPAGSPVKNSAITSTGVVPFMERFSRSTKEVAQDGRRGALMESISIKHPDSEKFIDAKLTSGTVTGANISVKLDDEFMERSISGKPYVQQFPIDSINPKITKEIDAQKLWKKIIHNAWKSAEPGILFWDKIINESIPDCYNEQGFKTISTNPCIVGSTLIAVADGRNFVSIKQLTEEGKDIPVYCLDNNGKLSIRTMRNPRITGYHQQIYKVTLEGGHTIRATGNHKFRLKDGSYDVETKDLKHGDSLHILTKYQSPIVRDNNLSKKDYFWLNNGEFKTSRIEHRLVKSYKNALSNGYNTEIRDNVVVVEKVCEDCGELFWIDYRRREVSFCSNKCALNHINNDINIKNKRTESVNIAYSNKGQDGKYNQLKIFKGLEFELKRTPLLKEWEERCKEINIPYRLKTKYGFKSFSEIKEESEYFNHKVISVELDGFEDVYNGTVDEFHNFFSGGFQELTKSGKPKYLSINQLNCGEIPLCADDSCRLLALNLFGYVIDPFTDDVKFDWELFRKDVIIAQRYMDDIIDLEIEKIDEIIRKIDSDPEDESLKIVERNLWERIKDKTIRGRRTGLGVTAEGDMLAALGLRYGTELATDFSEEVHKVLKLSAYRSSVTMSKERGSFPIFASKNEANNPFILRIKKEDPKLYDDMVEYGRRNIALLTIAPTGSSSIMSQTSSGIEPAFLVFYKRRRKINPQEKNTRVDFVDEEGVSWQEYPVFHHKFEMWLEKNGYDVEEVKNMKIDQLTSDIITQSPYYKATSNDVDWVKKVEMQGRIQKHVDHSISVTVNLPKDTTEEIVSKVYETGWRSGCKGITVYRDGSRSGVLVNVNEKKDDAYEIHVSKRPKRLKGEIHRFQNNLEKWIGVVGMRDGRPYEIFTGKLENGLSNLPSNVKECDVVKNVADDIDVNGNPIKVKRYDIEYTDNDGIKHTHSGLSHAFNPEFWNYSKLVSGVLRQRMPIVYVYDLVDSLNFKEDHINTWKNGVSRVIKKYITNGEKGKGKCTDCGSEHLHFVEGCLTCQSCGGSKCS